VHLEPQALAWLEQQPWPGNIRELGNLIERSVLLSDSPRVSAAQLSTWASTASDESDTNTRSASPIPVDSVPWADVGSGLRDYRSIDSHAPEVLREALRQHAGNQSRAARALGLTPRQFAYRWRHHGLTLSNTVEH
jgi:Nif-specific regulatory protein